MSGFGRSRRSASRWRMTADSLDQVLTSRPLVAASSERDIYVAISRGAQTRQTLRAAQLRCACHARTLVLTP